MVKETMKLQAKILSDIGIPLYLAYKPLQPRRSLFSNNI